MDDKDELMNERLLEEKAEKIFFQQLRSNELLEEILNNNKELKNE